MEQNIINIRYENNIAKTIVANIAYYYAAFLLDRRSGRVGTVA